MTRSLPLGVYPTHHGVSPHTHTSHYPFPCSQPLFQTPISINHVSIFLTFHLQFSLFISLKPRLTGKQSATLNFLMSYETTFSAAQNPISKITYPLDNTTCTEQGWFPEPINIPTKDVFMIVNKKNRKIEAWLIVIGVWGKGWHHDKG